MQKLFGENKIKILTRAGKVVSKWYKADGKFRYEIETPTDARVIIEGKEYKLSAGKYVF